MSKDNLLDTKSQQQETSPPPPPYTAKTTPLNLPHGHWNLACNIDVQGGDLQLNAKGEPVWTQDIEAADGAYRRDGFSVRLGLAQIEVANPAYSWMCDANTVAGMLLSSNNKVSLRNVGERLFVFEQAVERKEISDRPLPKLRDDSQGCLKVESGSGNVWAITGTDIYQIDGDKDDLAVLSPNFLRLWDIAKGKLRWERSTTGGKHILGARRIWGFTEEYVVRDVGYIHLYERKTGRDYGYFQFPSFPAFIDFNDDNHFGPVVSTNGLFLYKPCSKALFIFRISAREALVRIWESSDVIRGSILLRGGIEDLEVKLIGENPNWIKYEDNETVYKNSLFKRFLL
ncbi:hypothetical protein CI238_13090 [Colletotrichum incanum]|uniref:Uncharacterized protein n=1 Tax=Colletotrichum incanum TaxID=1573173 RepID=A0A167CBB4_COLIC|nr:hypothetical protein CI238_13090 [Colletotrichum incanum]